MANKKTKNDVKSFVYLGHLGWKRNLAQVSGWYVFEWMQACFKGCVYHSRENTALVTIYQGSN